MAQKWDRKYPKLPRFQYLRNFLKICTLIRLFLYFAKSWELINTIINRHSQLVLENSRWPKNWFESTQNCPVFNIYVIFSKSMDLTFFIFCIKLRIDKYLKLSLPVSLRIFFLVQVMERPNKTAKKYQIFYTVVFIVRLVS